jgi:hypothetical protein
MSTIPTEVPASVERRFPDGFHCGVYQVEGAWSRTAWGLNLAVG